MIVAIVGLLSFLIFIVSVVAVFFARWRRPASVALVVSLGMFVSAFILSPAETAGTSPTINRKPSAAGTQVLGKKVAHHLVDEKQHRTPQAQSNAGAGGGNWTYSDQKDQMRNSVTYFAWTASLDQLHLAFPYGSGRARLLLRRQPIDGLNVLLSIHGQFICNEYEGDYVSVKFDQGAIERFRCGEPNDGSPGWLFIREPHRFLKQLLHASRVTIEANFFENGRQQLTFNVTGLKWEAPQERSRRR